MRFSIFVSFLALALIVTTSSAHAKRTGRGRLPNKPASYLKGLSKIQRTWQKDVGRAYTRFNRVKQYSFATAQLANDLHSANLKAWNAGWQNAANSTPGGAMMRAAAAPFYGVFGGLQLPGPVQYTRIFTDALRHEMRSSGNGK